jgi:hypothetical protein
MHPKEIDSLVNLRFLFNLRKKIMKKLHAICLASLAALGSTQAIAQNAGHFYGGAGAGQSQSKINDNQINNALVGTSGTTTSTRMTTPMRPIRSLGVTSSIRTLVWKRVTSI